MSCSGICVNCTTGCQEILPKLDLEKRVPKFQYNSDLLSHPANVFLGVTARCNLSCPYCFVSQHNEDMSLETAIKACDMAIENGKFKGEKPSIIFFGGEPLLMFDEIIVPIVEKYKDIADFSITTNGVLLDEDKVDFFTKNNVSLLLSLDGIKEVQDIQRPGKGFSSFDKILNNIPYLLFRKPDITMRATVTKKSIKYIYESFLMGLDLGFKSFSFCVNAYEEWSEDDRQEYEDQINKICADIYFNAINGKEDIIRFDAVGSCINDFIRTFTGTAKFENNLSRCGLGTTTFTVCPNGDITTCQEKLSNPSFIIGNVFNGGINFNKHLEFLQFYYNSLNNIKCPSDCSKGEAYTCLQRFCPSRLEDMNFRISSSSCKSGKSLQKISRRIWNLTHDSISKRVQMSFYNEGGDV